MNNVLNYSQLKKVIEDSGFTEQELGIILSESGSSLIKFGISCYLNNVIEASEIISTEEKLEDFYAFLPDQNKSLFSELIISRSLELNPINSVSDAKKYLVNNEFLQFSDIEFSRQFNVVQKSALSLLGEPNKISDNGWNKEILNSFSVSELTSYYIDLSFLKAILPINPQFFIKNIISEDDVVIQNYISALMSCEISTESFFDSISSLSSNYICGKIIISEDLYSFEFENPLQATLFDLFNLKVLIVENDALFTEKQLGSISVDGELFFRDGKIIGDLKIEELSTLESFKAQFYNILSTTVTTIGKVASNPKTKVAMLALSALGVMGDAWAGDSGAGTESGIASILNNIEKAHTLKGFEGGKQFNALDAQLEQIGADLNDLKFPPQMDHRSIRFFGEEGDYTLKIGDTKVEFEYKDDGTYSTTIKNIEGSRGFIDSNDLKDWATKITNNLNKAVKNAE